jgi:hypothetical protein
MLNKITLSIEPFALTIIILAGASLAGWVNFSNGRIVGDATVFCGVLLTLNHVVKQFSNQQPVKKG